MREFRYAVLTSPLRYRSRLLINNINVRGTGHELKRRFSKLVEITQSKSHYAIQGHRYDFLLVINTKLSPTLQLHRFRYIALERSKIARFCYPSSV